MCRHTDAHRRKKRGDDQEDNLSEALYGFQLSPLLVTPPILPLIKIRGGEVGL
jgi:hypothetical protein